MNTAHKLLLTTVLAANLILPVQAQPDTQTIDTAGYSVPIMDLRDKDPELADAVAGRVSKRALIVYYLGNDIGTANKARLGASQAKAGGAPVKGMILAKADPDFKGGKDSFFIVVDGMPVTKQADAGEYPVIGIRRLLEWAAKEYGEDIDTSGL